MTTRELERLQFVCLRDEAQRLSDTAVETARVSVENWQGFVSRAELAAASAADEVNVTKRDLADAMQRLEQAPNIATMMREFAVEWQARIDALDAAAASAFLQSLLPEAT